MTFPAGVTLCEVRLPASATWQGGASTISATLTPNRAVVHRRTNTPLAAVTGSATGPSGAGLVLLVPHGDQNGYCDAAGNSISGWGYLLEASYRNAANVAVTVRRQVKIPRGAVYLDILSAVDYKAPDELLATGAPRLGIDVDGTPYFTS